MAPKEKKKSTGFFGRITRTKSWDKKQEKQYNEDDDDTLPWLTVQELDSSSVEVKVKSGDETVGELKVKAARKNGRENQEWFFLSGAEAGAGAGAEAGAEGEEEAAPLKDSATAAACGLAEVCDGTYENTLQYMHWIKCVSVCDCHAAAGRHGAVHGAR